MAIAPTTGRPIVDQSGGMAGRVRSWTQEITRLDILAVSGSPEGVAEAFQRQMYMDTAGIAGAILYIKRDADIAGDKTLGWILV